MFDPDTRYEMYNTVIRQWENILKHVWVNYTQSMFHQPSLHQLDQANQVISGPQSNTSHSPVISQLHKQFSWADQWQIPPSLRLAVAAARAHSLPGPHGVSWKKWDGDGLIYPTKTWGKTMRKPLTSPVLRVNPLAFYKIRFPARKGHCLLPWLIASNGKQTRNAMVVPWRF